MTPLCQLIQNEGLTGTHCRLNPEVSYRLRYICSTQNCIPAPKSPSHNEVQN